MLSYLGYISLRIAVAICSIIPFRLLYLLSDGAFYLLRHALRYRLNIVRTNLHHSFPNISPTELDLLTNQFYRHLADILLEGIKGLSMSRQDFQQRYTYLNSELINDGENDQVILAGGHLANWEWGVLSVSQAIHRPVMGIYKQISNPYIDHYLQNKREKFGLLLTEMQQAGRAMITHPACVFVFFADQSPTGRRSAHWLDFLHQRTAFHAGLGKSGARLNCRVVYFEITRKTRGYYQVRFTSMPRSSDPVSPETITHWYAQQLEQTIIRSPSDWLWSHRRWKMSEPLKRS